MELKNGVDIIFTLHYLIETNIIIFLDNFIIDYTSQLLKWKSFVSSLIAPNRRTHPVPSKFTDFRYLTAIVLRRPLYGLGLSFKNSRGSVMTNSKVIFTAYLSAKSSNNFLSTLFQFNYLQIIGWTCCPCTHIEDFNEILIEVI